MKGWPDTVPNSIRLKPHFQSRARGSAQAKWSTGSQPELS